MAKFNEQYVFTGMQRDMDVSKHPASFLYDARNIRLTQRDGKDTLYAITNEKGTTPLEVDVQGSYLGHAQINNFLVVFSTDGSTDYISTIDLNSYITTILYEGNLNFDINCPITAVGSYENENIQKVYWTDGKNQPRMINIAGTIRLGIDTQFDFLPELALNETVTIKKQVGSVGSFPAGVLQYMFTYYNKHGHESNIFYTSPLLYISPADRGAAPDEKVSNSFQINISNVDLNFDYLRIYSIHRSSINGTPSAKLVEDIAIISEPTDEVSSGSGNIVRFPNLFYAQLSSDSAYISGLALSQKGYLTSTPISLEGSEEEFWYVFRYSDCPELRLRYYSIDAISQEERANYITWGDFQVGNSQEDRQDWVIYVTAIPVTIEGTKGATILCFNESRGTRTSEDRRPLKYVQKRAAVTSYSYIDTGTRGESIDPMELLYKQKDKVVGGTIEQKDGTLFLGNLSYSPTILEYKDTIKSSTTIASSTRQISFPNASNDNVYNYQNQLTAVVNSDPADPTNGSSVPCSGFKKGDYYRLGVQFQDKYGKWSDPVFIKDDVENKRPTQTISNNNVTIPTFTGYLPSTLVTSLKALGYKKVRAVVVYPDIQDREILCQGVTNPSVYRQSDFSKNKVAGQSSWFFRPRHKDFAKILSADDTTRTGSTVCAPIFEGEISTAADLSRLGQIGDTRSSSRNFPRLWEIQGYYTAENRFQVFDASANTVLSDFGFDTFHSPDVQFDPNVINQKFNSTIGKLVGYTKITNTLSDIDIQTVSPTISNLGSGFDHQSSTTNSARGIIAGLFYDDYVVDELKGSNPPYFREYTVEKSSVKWLVYPWHRSGALNNDLNRPANAGTRSAELKTKKLSNLRYGTTHWESSWEESSININFVYTPELFYSDETTILKINDYLYKGNVDTVLMPDVTDGMYFCYNDYNNVTINQPVMGAVTDLHRLSEANIITPFNSTSWWKTFAITDEINATPTENGTIKVYITPDYGVVRILLNGVVQPSTSQGYYSYTGTVGTLLDLQVNPIDNYTVKQWRRGSSSVSPVIAGTSGNRMISVRVAVGTTSYYAELTLDTNSSIPANMATVELDVYPENAGTITGAVSREQYPIGSVIPLTAVPNTSAGYSFNHWENWSGNIVGNLSTLNITVASGGNYYKAIFASIYTITVAKDYGVATAYVGTQANPTDTSVTVSGTNNTVYLTNTASSGNTFIGWLKYEGNNNPELVSTTPSTSIQVSGTTTFKAISKASNLSSIDIGFKLYIRTGETTYQEIDNQATVMNIADVLEYTGVGTYLHHPVAASAYTTDYTGNEIFFPDIINTADFAFWGWGIGSTIDTTDSYCYWYNVNPSNGTKLQDGDFLSLILQPLNYYTVTIGSEGGGGVCTVTMNGSNTLTNTFLAGTIVTLAATEGTNYSFDGWYNGTSLLSSSLNYSFYLTGAVNYTAKFTYTGEFQYSLELVDGNNTNNSVTHVEYDSTNATYSPSTIGFKVTKINTSTTHTVATYRTATELIAQNLKLFFDNSSSGNGWVTGGINDSDNVSSYNLFDGALTSKVRLMDNSALPSSLITSVDIEIPSVSFVVASEGGTPKGTISNNGTIYLNGGTSYYSYNTSVTFTATAASDYTFSHWLKDNAVVDTSTISFNVTSAHTLEAVFTASSSSTYSINTAVSPAGGGTVTGAGDYNAGTQVTLVATPAANYTFARWELNGNPVSTNQTYQFTPNASGTYTAVFTTANMVTISMRAASGYGGQSYSFMYYEYNSTEDILVADVNYSTGLSESMDYTRTVPIGNKIKFVMNTPNGYHWNCDTTSTSYDDPTNKITVTTDLHFTLSQQTLY